MDAAEGIDVQIVVEMKFSWIYSMTMSTWDFSVIEIFVR